MRKLLFAVPALAFAAASAYALARPGCDMKTTEKRWFCKKCDKLFPKSETKIRKCPEDKADLVQVDLCVKQKYVALCHPTKSGSKPVTCCGNVYDKATPDEAGIFHACQTCGAKARRLPDLKHLESCTDKKTKKTCEHGA
jgi:hypothetical protein